MLKVTALAKSGEVGVVVVGRVLIEMGAGDADQRHRQFAGSRARIWQR